MPDQPSYQQRQQAQYDSMGVQAGFQASAEAASRQVSKRHENPEFFQQLRSADVDTDEYDWVEKELGPAFAGAHLVGQREESYERERKWLNRNSAERLLAESNPGRLCSGAVRKIAQGVADRPDKTERVPYTQDEKRVVREAMEVATNYQSLAVGAKGLDSVTTATTVSKVEKQDNEQQSRRERAANMLD